MTICLDVSLIVVLVFLPFVKLQNDGSGICPPVLDIVILFDTSGGNDTVFEQQKNWTIGIVRELPIHDEAVRVALIQYSEEASTIFNLSRFSERNDIIDYLGNIDFIRGETKSGVALIKAEHEIFDYTSGARLNANRLIIIFTDGLSNDNPTKPSKILRKRGVKIFTISVNSIGFVPEMLGIAGNADNIFGPPDEERLQKRLVDEVEHSRSCDVQPKRSEKTTSSFSTRTLLPTVSTVEEREANVTGETANKFSDVNEIDEEIIEEITPVNTGNLTSVKSPTEDISTFKEETHGDSVVSTLDEVIETSNDSSENEKIVPVIASTMIIDLQAVNTTIEEVQEHINDTSIATERLELLESTPSTTTEASSLDISKEGVSITSNATITSDFNPVSADVTATTPCVSTEILNLAKTLAAATLAPSSPSVLEFVRNVTTTAASLTSTDASVKSEVSTLSPISANESSTSVSSIPDNTSTSAQSRTLSASSSKSTFTISEETKTAGKLNVNHPTTTLPFSTRLTFRVGTTPTTNITTTTTSNTSKHTIALTTRGPLSTRALTPTRQSATHPSLATVTAFPTLLNIEKSVTVALDKSSDLKQKKKIRRIIKRRRNILSAADTDKTPQTNIIEVKPTTPSLQSRLFRSTIKPIVIEEEREIVTPGIQCPMDILFVVDSSGSITKTYDSQKDFLTSLIKRVEPTRSHRVGLIQFSGPHIQKMEWSFDTHSKNSQLLSAIRSVRHLTGTTYIGAALELSLILLDSRRKHTETTVILVSDGFSQDDSTQQAKLLRQLPNVKMYAVSLNKLTNTKYLTDIVGDRKNIFINEETKWFEEFFTKKLKCIPTSR